MSKTAPYMNCALSVEARVEDLLKRMTIEEKAAHVDDPNWSLTGFAERRKIDQKGAFPAVSTARTNSLGTAPTP